MAHNTLMAIRYRPRRCLAFSVATTGKQAATGTEMGAPGNRWLGLRGFWCHAETLPVTLSLCAEMDPMIFVL